MSRDWNIVENDPAPEAEEPETRLDVRRIQILARERRAIHRARQWAVGASIFTALLAAICVSRAFTWFQQGHVRPACVAMLFAAVVMMLMLRFARRARRQPPGTPSPPPVEPRFDELSDGSHRREALRDLGGEA